MASFSTNMQTFFLILKTVAFVVGATSVPIAVLWASDRIGWRAFFRGASFEVSSYFLTWSLSGIRTACFLSIAAGGCLLKASRLRQVRRWDLELQVVEVSKLIGFSGLVMLGVAVCFYLVARRRAPCILVDGLAVEFHRNTAQVAQVHIQRKSWHSLHWLGEHVASLDRAPMHKQLGGHPLAPAADAMVHPQILRKLKGAGVERLEIFSPLLRPAAVERLNKDWGRSLPGCRVEVRTFYIGWIEAIFLLAMRALTWSTWLRKNSRWVRDKAILNDRIAPAQALRPSGTGLSISLAG